MKPTRIAAIMAGSLCFGVMPATAGARQAPKSANRAPTVTAPAAAFGAEDFPISLRVSVADPDARRQPLEATIAADSGAVLSLPRTRGLRFLDGDGRDDVVMTFRGRVGAVRAALRNVVFTPPPNQHGNATARFWLDDLGHGGRGGARIAHAATHIRIASINDLPAITVPPPLQTSFDTARTFSHVDNSEVLLADPDAEPLDVRLNTYQAGSSDARGTLTLSRTDRLRFRYGDGTDDTTMAFAGTAQEINAALDGMTWTPPDGFTGIGRVNVSVSDGDDDGPIFSEQSDTATVEVAP
jgi:hypothetical protein